MTKKINILSLVLSAAILLSPTLSSAQQTRFEDEANKQQAKKNSFPSLMEESLGVLFEMEQFITRRSKSAEKTVAEGLLRKLRTFTFTQDLDDLNDDQKETLSLAKATMKDVISLLDHQMAAADTVSSVGSAHNRTIHNLIGRRGEIESQTATIRLQGLHYSHPGHGLNQAIKASYEALSMVAFALEDDASAKADLLFDDTKKLLKEAITSGRFALNRWRFRSSTGEEKNDNLIKLADSYDASFDVEEQVRDALDGVDATAPAQQLLDVLVELEGARIAARDARLEVAKKKD